MSTHFVVNRGVRDHFVTEKELEGQARAGLLGPKDRVYHPELGRWLYAKEIAEVQDALAEAQKLYAQKTPPDHVVLVPPNGLALAGLVLSILGLLPLVGLPLSGVGLFLSGRGLTKAQTLYGSGHKTAIAGLLVALCTLSLQVGLLLLL